MSSVNDTPVATAEQEPGEVRQWVQQQMEIEAVAAEVVRIEELQKVERRLTEEIQGLNHRLAHTHDMLRALVLETCAQRWFPENPASVDGRLAARKRQILIEMLNSHDARVGLGLRVGQPPPDSPAGQPQVRTEDCAARKPFCQAACCRLPFSLTESEIRDGHVQWSLDYPFVRLAGPDGYCIHLDRKTLTCSIYENRPVTCRHYLCRNDKRIWQDYEGCEIAPALARSLQALESKNGITDPVTCHTLSPCGDAGKGGAADCEARNHLEHPSDGQTG